MRLRSLFVPTLFLSLAACTPRPAEPAVVTLTGTTPVGVPLVAGTRPELEPNDSPATSTALVIGTSASGERDQAGDVDFFRIDAAEGALLSLLSQNAALVRVLDGSFSDVPGYRPLAVGPGFVVTDGGPLFLEVQPIGQGPYVVSAVRELTIVPDLEPNDTLDQALPLFPGEPAIGVSQQRDDVDVYAFLGRGGQRVTLTLGGAERGSAILPQLVLHGPGGVIAQGSAGSDAPRHFDAILPRSGVYAVEVAAPPGSNITGVRAYYSLLLESPL
ncbi:MAG: hypothetical protein HY335_00690 [Deinococcus sp.]|nr:hypothetical protein [Deinococcus sp.]